MRFPSARRSLAQTTDVEFFEAKIRPVLAQRCYACHNSKMAAPKGDLILDTKEGLLKGGVSGPVLVPGKPADSRLMKVLSYTDPLVADAAQRQAARRGSRRLHAMDCQRRRRSSRERTGARVRVACSTKACRWRRAANGGRSSRSPRMRRRSVAPAQGRPVNKIDSFVLAKLAEKNLQPSPQADKRTLVTRAYVDLLGYKPTFEEVQAFVNDRSPNAYENLIDRLHGVAALRRALGRATGWTWRATPKTTRHRRRRIRRIHLPGGIATGSSKR